MLVATVIGLIGFAVVVFAVWVGERLGALDPESTDDE